MREIIIGPEDRPGGIRRGGFVHENFIDASNVGPEGGRERVTSGVGNVLTSSNESADHSPPHTESFRQHSLACSSSSCSSTGPAPCSPLAIASSTVSFLKKSSMSCWWRVGWRMSCVKEGWSRGPGSRGGLGVEGGRGRREEEGGRKEEERRGDRDVPCKTTRPSHDDQGGKHQARRSNWCDHHC